MWSHKDVENRVHPSSHIFNNYCDEEREWYVILTLITLNSFEPALPLAFKGDLVRKWRNTNDWT